MSHEQFQGALSINESSEGEIEASILGNDVSSHDLEKKKAELEEMKAYNFFSSIGKNVSRVYYKSNRKNHSIHSRFSHESRESFIDL